MLYTSVVTLYLVCFLHCFEPVQCRSTRHTNEYDNRSILTRQCLRSCFLISRHQTCFEKCLGKNKDGDFTDLNARILRINPPHLTSTFNRRKRDTGGVDYQASTKHPATTRPGAIPCPGKTEGNNSFPTSRALVRQYENSSERYLNISWDSLPDSTNFTGYGIKYLCNSEQVYIEMQKNETFKILNANESCWRPDIKFWYIVLGLPCLGYHDLVNKYKTPLCPSSPATPSVKVTVATTDKLFSTASEGTANFDEFSTKVSTAYNDATGSLETKQHNKKVAEVWLTVITIPVVLVFVISATYLYLRKRKKDKRYVSVGLCPC